MKLVPSEFDEYNPVVILIAAIFVIGGGYPLLMMRGPLIVWLFAEYLAVICNRINNPHEAVPVLETRPDFRIGALSL
jgi:hypothetical protein